jgi:hypothetical protein
MKALLVVVIKQHGNERRLVFVLSQLPGKRNKSLAPLTFQRIPVSESCLE